MSIPKWAFVTGYLVLFLGGMAYQAFFWWRTIRKGIAAAEELGLSAQTLTTAWESPHSTNPTVQDWPKSSRSVDYPHDR